MPCLSFLLGGFGGHSRLCCCTWPCYPSGNGCIVASFAEPLQGHKSDLTSGVTAKCTRNRDRRCRCWWRCASKRFLKERARLQRHCHRTRCRSDNADCMSLFNARCLALTHRQTSSDCRLDPRYIFPRVQSNLQSLVKCLDQA